MASLTRRTIKTLADAVGTRQAWATVAVLLVVLMLLPVSARSPIDSITEECGISILSPLLDGQGNSVAITAARVGFVADVPMCVCDPTIESLASPVEASLLSMVLRI